VVRAHGCCDTLESLPKGSRVRHRPRGQPGPLQQVAWVCAALGTEAFTSLLACPGCTQALPPLLTLAVPGENPRTQRAR